MYQMYQKLQKKNRFLKKRRISISRRKTIRSAQISWDFSTGGGSDMYAVSNFIAIIKDALHSWVNVNGNIGKSSVYLK